jgi:hypothetical protein
MRKNPSFIKDTTAFINKIKNFKCKEGSILVSADVSGLYTVINHEEGTAACKEALNTRSTGEKKSMPTRFITRLILLILKSNCFNFFGRYFHQLTGTAMGTPMAPSYANIFMGKVEKQMLNEYRKKTGKGPDLWFRFLDDVFFVWSSGAEELKKFTDYMQNYSKEANMKTELKYTFETGQEVPFLDSLVSIGVEGLLETKLYSKKTDAHLLPP